MESELMPPPLPAEEEDEEDEEEEEEDSQFRGGGREEDREEGEEDEEYEVRTRASRQSGSIALPRAPVRPVPCGRLGSQLRCAMQQDSGGDASPRSMNSGQFEDSEQHGELEKSRKQMDWSSKYPIGWVPYDPKLE